jgi:RimJ/RimL family protein N-acetyltransferase
LSDDVVLLKPMTLDDVEAHLEGEDELWVRFASGGVGTVETATRWIEANTRSWQTDGPMRAFGIWEIESGAICGSAEANLALDGVRPGVATISYALHPWARGRGYATRSVRLIVDYLTESTDADVAMIQIEPENHASLGVPARAGFKCVGERITERGDHYRTFIHRLAR